MKKEHQIKFEQDPVQDKTALGINDDEWVEGLDRWIHNGGPAPEGTIDRGDVLEVVRPDIETPEAVETPYPLPTPIFDIAEQIQNEDAPHISTVPDDIVPGDDETYIEFIKGKKTNPNLPPQNPKKLSKLKRVVKDTMQKMLPHKQPAPRGSIAD